MEKIEVYIKKINDFIIIESIEIKLFQESNYEISFSYTERISKKSGSRKGYYKPGYTLDANIEKIMEGHDEWQI